MLSSILLLSSTFSVLFTTKAQRPDSKTAVLRAWPGLFSSQDRKCRPELSKPRFKGCDIRCTDCNWTSNVNLTVFQSFSIVKLDRRRIREDMDTERRESRVLVGPGQSSRKVVNSRILPEKPTRHIAVPLFPLSISRQVKLSARAMNKFHALSGLKLQQTRGHWNRAVLGETIVWI